MVPDAGYLRSAHQLLQKHNALLIADEVQTGLGRTGKILASHHDGVQPDILVLGKALSGGIYPVSAVLANDEVMTSSFAALHRHCWHAELAAGEVVIWRGAECKRSTHASL